MHQKGVTPIFVVQILKFETLSSMNWAFSIYFRPFSPLRNRFLFMKSQCLLFSAALVPTLWGEIVLRAAYVFEHHLRQGFNPWCISNKIGTFDSTVFKFSNILYSKLLYGKESNFIKCCKFLNPTLSKLTTTAT